MLDFVQKILAKITKRRIRRINRFTPCTSFENSSGGMWPDNHRRRRSVAAFGGGVRRWRSAEAFGGGVQHCWPDPTFFANY